MVTLIAQLMILTESIETECDKDPASCSRSRFVDYMRVLGIISGSFYSVLAVVLLSQFVYFNYILKKIFARERVNKGT